MKKSTSNILRSKASLPERKLTSDSSRHDRRTHSLVNPSTLDQTASTPALPSQGRVRTHQSSDRTSFHESVRLVRYFYQQPQKQYKDHYSVNDYMKVLQDRLSDYRHRLANRASCSPAFKETETVYDRDKLMNPIFKTTRDTPLAQLLGKCRKAQRDLRPLRR